MKGLHDCWKERMNTMRMMYAHYKLLYDTLNPIINSKYKVQKN